MRDVLDALRQCEEVMYSLLEAAKDGHALTPTEKEQLRRCQESVSSILARMNSRERNLLWLAFAPGFESDIEPTLPKFRRIDAGTGARAIAKHAKVQTRIEL
jgi:hypothetical protein